jgi:DNA-binding CsgD family transcriptional regulator
MAKTKLGVVGHWYDRMQVLLREARYSEAAELYDRSTAGGVPSADAVLLRALLFLKQRSEKVTSFLLKHRLEHASQRQLATRAMYLGSGYALLGDFVEADRYFAQAQRTFRQGAALAELAAHLTCRYLAQRDFESAEQWRRKTLADRSRAGKIRSERLRSSLLERREEYREQVESLLTVLDLIGAKREEHIEAWYAAVSTLAVLARELPIPAAAERAKLEVNVDHDWSSDFAVARFQAINSVAWCQALAGDELSCLRYLRRAGHLAPAPVWQAILYLDRSYFASIVGEGQWAANEFSTAQDVAEKIEWEQTSSEERVALLLLAELAAVHAPKCAPYYLARFNELGRSRAHLRHLSVDGRLNAMAFYAGGIVEAVDRHHNTATERLRSAWSIFDRIGYDMRAGRTALALYRLTGKPRWLHLAEDKLESYPRSWLMRERKGLSSAPSQDELKLPRMQDTVMRLVCEGMSTDAMAQRLKLSRNTILNHLKVIYKKVGVNSREGLVVEAMRRGLLR